MMLMQVSLLSFKRATYGCDRSVVPFHLCRNSQPTRTIWLKTNVYVWVLGMVCALFHQYWKFNFKILQFWIPQIQPFMKCFPPRPMVCYDYYQTTLVLSVFQQHNTRQRPSANSWSGQRAPWIGLWVDIFEVIERKHQGSVLPDFAWLPVCFLDEILVRKPVTIHTYSLIS